MREAALHHAVSGYFTQVTGAELPQLGCDGVFLHQWLLEGETEAVDLITSLWRLQSCSVSNVLFLSPCSDLSVVELHGVVGRQRHTQALLQKLPQGVLGVLQEQAVVAQGGHGDRDLGQVVEVLQNWTLRRGGG